MTQKLLFIGGCPRSGTALVQYLLNLHPDVSLTGEEHPSMQDITQRMLGAPEHVVVGDKSPRYSITWPLLREAFPECLLVFTHRDFRATVKSIMRQTWAPADEYTCECDLVLREQQMALCTQCYHVQLELLEQRPVTELLSLLKYVGLSELAYPMTIAVDVILNGDVNRSK